MVQLNLLYLGTIMDWRFGLVALLTDMGMLGSRVLGEGGGGGVFQKEIRKEC